jgi:hypothetical protein
MPSFLHHITTLSVLIIFLFTLTYSQYEYKKEIVETCSVDLLCNQYLSYSFPLKGYSQIFLYSEKEFVLDTICMTFSVISKSIYNPDFIENRVYCNQTLDRSSSYQSIIIPLVLSEGLYSVSFFAASRNEHFNIFENQYHYILPFSDLSKEPFPFNYQLTSPPFGSLVAGKLKLLFKPYYSNSQQHHAVVLCIDGAINNILPENADIVETQNELEPGSWFISVLPVSNAEIAYSLVTEMFLSLQVDQTVLPYIFHPQKYEERRKSGNETRRMFSVADLSLIDYGLPYYHYLEIVLSDDELTKQRLFHSQQRQQLNEQTLQLQLIQEKLNWKNQLKKLFRERRFNNILKSRSLTAVHPGGSLSMTNKMNICITSGGSMDGQKRIWLQQTEYLNSEKYSFTWILSFLEGGTVETLNASNPNSFYNQLLQVTERNPSKNIKILNSLYNYHVIEEEELSQIPPGETISASMLWQTNKTKLFEYLHERYNVAHRKLEDITPPWCYEFYQVMKRMLIDNGCHVIVYGNGRGFNTDVFITDVAKILGIPSITELLNLYLDNRAIPDIIVGPSLHSLKHQTIQQPVVINQAHNGYKELPLQVVIAPSVNQEIFSPSNVTAALKKAKGCSFYHNFTLPFKLTKEGDVFTKHYPCILVGFVGRLSIGKLSLSFSFLLDVSCFIPFEQKKILHYFFKQRIMLYRNILF